MAARVLSGPVGDLVAVIALLIVREEGGPYEWVNPLTWLLSDAPIWGIAIGRLLLIYDTILKRLGYQPWRSRVLPPPLEPRYNLNTDRWEFGF